VGQGRIKDQCSYPRPQAEEKDNVHHEVHQRGAGYEETTSRTHHCVDVENQVSGSNGTASRESTRSHYKGIGSQDIYVIDPGRVPRVDH
jgi:hypothetical protein